MIATIPVVGAPLLTTWVNTPNHIRNDTLIYICVIAVAMVCHGFIMSAQADLTDFGYTLDILAIGVVSNIVYIGPECALVCGAFGFPEMGVYVAA